MTLKKCFSIILLLLCFIADAQRGRWVKRLEKSGTELKKSPDYNNLYYWASHPEKKDLADSIPPFLINESRDSSADVFFIHPTTFTKGILQSELNADIDNAALNDETDKKIMLLQATIFNGSCKIYAPRYRQAHLKTFFSKNEPSSIAAFELAYSDVKKAFEYYLRHYNHNRPVIIAGHSQGAFHAVRLLKEYFDGKPLQRKLVCAYVVGWQIKKDDFNTLPLGNNATQTGCIVGWRSFRNKTTDKSVTKENGNSLCVNPISWKTDNTYTNKADHKGMVGRKFDKIYPHIIAASVEPTAGILWVDIPAAQDESNGFINNFHIADFNMFYMDVRENVRDRIKAFLKKN